MNIDLSQDAPTVARQLIGCTLTVQDAAEVRGGIIIETEAYTANDPASHSFRGKTSRNSAMYMAPGTLYIYRIYGMHLCLNIVCGNHDGQAVLIRALLPTQGLEYMRERRRQADITALCSGPAKLVQALGVEQALNGSNLQSGVVTLEEPIIQPQVRTSRRIGISKAVDVLWRFELDS